MQRKDTIFQFYSGLVALFLGCFVFFSCKSFRKLGVCLVVFGTILLLGSSPLKPETEFYKGLSLAELSDNRIFLNTILSEVEQNPRYQENTRKINTFKTKQQELELPKSEVLPESKNAILEKMDIFNSVNKELETEYEEEIIHESFWKAFTQERVIWSILLIAIYLNIFKFILQNRTRNFVLVIIFGISILFIDKDAPVDIGPEGYSYLDISQEEISTECGKRRARTDAMYQDNLKRLAELELSLKQKQ